MNVRLSSESASSASALAEWEELLAGYSAALDEHRSVLLCIEDDVAAELDVAAAPSFTLPTGVSPMPPEVVPWAQTLMNTTDALMQLAKELATRSELHRPTRPPHAPVASEATLDALL